MPVGSVSFFVADRCYAVAATDLWQRNVDLVRRFQPYYFHRVASFLLPVTHPAGDAATDLGARSAAHLRRLAEQHFPMPARQIVFQEYVCTVTQNTERLLRLEAELKDQVSGWPLAPLVVALQGVRFRVAATMMAELGDL